MSGISAGGGFGRWGVDNRPSVVIDYAPGRLYPATAGELLGLADIGRSVTSGAHEMYAVPFECRRSHVFTGLAARRGTGGLSGSVFLRMAVFEAGPDGRPAARVGAVTGNVGIAAAPAGSMAVGALAGGAALLERRLYWLVSTWHYSLSGLLQVWGISGVDSGMSQWMGYGAGTPARALYRTVSDTVIPESLDGSAWLGGRIGANGLVAGVTMWMLIFNESGELTEAHEYSEWGTLLRTLTGADAAALLAPEGGE